MTEHAVATREEWLQARRDLLAAEKDLTYRSDAIARQRQALPWVKVDKDYRFATDGGEADLKGLFRGRTQMIIYHFMFGPDFKAGCPSCSAIADGFEGSWQHLAHHDVMFWAISRAPLQKLDAYKARMGWSFPWASSFGSDFNSDFAVGITEEQLTDEGYNYNFEAKPPSDPRPNPWSESTGTDAHSFMREMPGMSSFVLEDGHVYHCYSAYARGLDGLWGMYQWLDRAPFGRNEDGVGLWWKRSDEYGAL
jgi:predicted dithiol-disulfide oxidoreductase (DUF899 family)